MPYNVYWLVDGTIVFGENSWVFGSFFSTDSVVVNDLVSGHISIFFRGPVNLHKTNSLAAFAVSSFIPQEPIQSFCSLSCIETNLIVNGNFSASPNCISTPNANGFNTDLLYKKGEVDPNRPCYEPISSPNYYKIDDELGYLWNRQCFSNVADITGDGKNIFFVDAFRLYDTYTDTTKNLIWGQSVTGVEPGREYLFYFFSTNINKTQISPSNPSEPSTPLRFMFNGVELPNTRYAIPPLTFKWQQHCIRWTAPGNIGGPLINVNIEIRQTKDFYSSGSGQDFVIDEINFGKVGSLPTIIVANNTTDYCRGETTTLSVVDSKPFYTFQWYLNGVPIQGATSSTFIATVAGNYELRGISNGGCQITSNILPVTIAPLVGQYINHTVTNTVTWTSTNNPFSNANTVAIKNNLIINSGVTLTIKGMRFEFGNNAKIIVRPNAKLILESDGTVPTILTAYSCVNTMWKGVELYSNATQFGVLESKASTIIEHARVAISNQSTNPKSTIANTGYVNATGTTFQNNYIAVQLNGKKVNDQLPIGNNLSSFNQCQFFTTNKLKDAILYPDGLHKSFVELSYCRGIVFTDCDFKNSHYLLQPAGINNVFDEAILTKNKGISSLFSTFKMSGQANNFTNLWVGIDYAHNLLAKSSQEFVDINFGSNSYGIILRSGLGIKVIGCEFYIDPAYPNEIGKISKFYVGINSRGSSGFTFNDNSFTEGYCGIIVKNADTKKGSSLIQNNEFMNVGKVKQGRGQGIYCLGSNTTLQVRCNKFYSALPIGNSQLSEKVQNHWVSNGSMNTQGKCNFQILTAPAGKRFEGAEPVNSDIYALQPETGFIYNTHDVNIPVIAPKFKETTADMTMVYVNNCSQTYNPIAACSPVESVDINVLLHELEDAIQNQSSDELISMLVSDIVRQYKTIDSTGVLAKDFLNATPHPVAKWMLVGWLYELGEYSNAALQLDQLVLDNDERIAINSYYTLLLSLEQDSLDLNELNESQRQLLELIAEQEYAVSFDAQAILHFVFGNGFSIPLPYEETAELPVWELVLDSTKTLNKVILAPNPSSDLVTLTGNEAVAIQEVKLYDLKGALQEIVWSDKNRIFSVKSLPLGLYFVCIVSIDGNVTYQKLIVAGL